VPASVSTAGTTAARPLVTPRPTARNFVGATPGQGFTICFDGDGNTARQ
jgi:hypothetical protein